MPGRKIAFFNDQYYHVFNRGVEKRKIFLTAIDYKHALQALWFYQKINLPISLSKFRTLPVGQQLEMTKNIAKLPNRIDIVCYCFMPNHVHLLLKQTLENGISGFMGDFQNSFTRYFNAKNKRKGHLFEGQFKAVRIESDNQLLHTSRYIHLNPTTSFLVKETQLSTYQWSSFPEYINENMIEQCGKTIVLEQFKTRDDYKKFVYDQIDYQRTLKEIEHLALEDN